MGAGLGDAGTFTLTSYLRGNSHSVRTNSPAYIIGSFLAAVIPFKEMLPVAGKAAPAIERALPETDLMRGEIDKVAGAVRELPGGTGQALAGHGYESAIMGTFVVPEGTTVILPPSGLLMEQSIGLAIEGGEGGRSRQIIAGGELLNLGDFELMAQDRPCQTLS
jgi:hypothetical protein